MVRTSGYPIVLSADRTLMSDYAGNVFFGFSASTPRGFLPDWFYFHFLCPSVPVNQETGDARYAPIGIRKIEAKLLRYGFTRDEVVVAHPKYLDKAIGSDTKAVGISTFDPLGIGPVTSTFSYFLGGKKAYNAEKFKNLIEQPALRQPHLKVIVGGPGTWQLTDRQVAKELGIDTIVLGEAENVVGPLFETAVNGGPLPHLVTGTPVKAEEIPNIVGPTICGLVEVARGCGRGCDFCNPTLTQLKCRSVEDVVKEVKVNVRSGQHATVLHSEDIFRYQANGLKPNQKAVEDLFKAVCNVDGVEEVYVSHGAFASILSAPTMLRNLSEVMQLDRKNWRAYQVGLETGSSTLITRHLAGKCKPFKPEEWPEVVSQATGISNDAYWLPVATLIMGLPGETADDVTKTLELIDDLRNDWIMFYPLLLAPTGHLARSDYHQKQLLPEHFELFFRCWDINLRLWPKTFNDVSSTLKSSPIEKTLIKILLNVGVFVSLRIMRGCSQKLQKSQPFKIGKNTFQLKQGTAS